MTDKKKAIPQKLWEIDLEVAQRIKQWKVEQRSPRFAADTPEITVMDGKGVRHYIKKPYWVEGRGSDLGFFQPTKNAELCLTLVQDFADQSEKHAASFVEMLKAELEEKLGHKATDFDLIQASGRLRCLALLNSFEDINSASSEEEEKEDPKSRNFKCSNCGGVIAFTGAKSPTRACPKCDQKKVEWEELPPA